MPRRNYNDSNVVATFTEDHATTQKSKYMAPRSMRLASHNKTRVAYFHDEGVGNYHYGVSVHGRSSYIEKKSLIVIYIL